MKINMSWVHVLYTWPNPNPKRWTQEQINELKLALLRAGFITIADCIGSLEFDLVEAYNNWDNLP